MSFLVGAIAMLALVGVAARDVRDAWLIEIPACAVSRVYVGTLREAKAEADRVREAWAPRRVTWRRATREEINRIDGDVTW